MDKYRQVTMQAAAVATGNGVAADCYTVNDGAYANLTAQVQGITTATITWEATVDGANWVAVQATNLNTGTAATTTTADGLFRIKVAGFRQVRARISAYTAGTITVTGLLTEL